MHVKTAALMLLLGHHWFVEKPEGWDHQFFLEGVAT